MILVEIVIENSKFDSMILVIGKSFLIVFYGEILYQCNLYFYFKVIDSMVKNLFL